MADIMRDRMTALAKDHSEMVQLYKVVHQVAKKFGVPTNDDFTKFLNRHGITQQSSHYQDNEFLKGLGIPGYNLERKKILACEGQGSSTFFSGWWFTPLCNEYLIGVASFIVLCWQQEIAKEQLKPPPKPKIRDISLGLVLKGTDLGKISEKNTLFLADIQELLQKANYFLCTSRESTSWEKLNSILGTEESDRTSEQQVLLIIDFESELEEGETFRNKLEVQQFLKKGNPKFTVNSIKTLNKVAGLSRVGFVRS